MTPNTPSQVRSARSCCTFIPPQLLRRIAAAERSTDTDASVDQSCERTLRIDTEFRQRRAQAALQSPVRAGTPSAATTHRWVIHSAGNSERLPGDVARAEGDPATDDPAVDEAYVWSQQIWDLYDRQFGRASFDGAGSTVSVTVHFGQDYDNAFWDGQQLVFGDGDGEIFERFTKPADVLAHEFTHGVVQYTAGLVYRDQPGALNESVADVFAAMSVQHAAGQAADQATWLIGEGLFRPGVQARALRSMLEPGTAYDDPRLGRDPQVGSMADYVDTTDDNGGVHVNSGIPNRAFALAATSIGGPSWERAGKVWYAALTSDRVDTATDFAGFAEATVAAAEELFGDSDVPARVRAAWVEVGVLTDSVLADVFDSGRTEASGSSVAAASPDSSTSPSSPEPLDQPPAATGESSSTDAPQKVAVRRTGGFAGQVRSAALELGDDPRAEEVRRLLRRVNLQEVTSTDSVPDRFVYTVEVGDQSITVGEQDLPPDLQRVVQIVLGSRGPDLPGVGPDLG